VKLQTLQELDAVFSDTSFLRAWPPGLFCEFLLLLRHNLFRELPPLDPVLLSTISEPPMAEIAWPHLQLVYSLLLKYQQANPADARFNLAFCSRIVRNLNAPDKNERDLVLLYIERYVSTHHADQGAVLKLFHHLLNLYLERAIGPFALGPIVRFYANHWPDPSMSAPALRQLLRVDLVPLLSAPHFGAIAAPLGALLETIADCEPAFAARFLEAAVRKWPLSAPTKQPLVLGLVVSVVDRIPRPFFDNIMARLCGALAHYAQSPHAQVALMALQACSSGRVLRHFIARDPLMLTEAIDSASGHWDVAVRQAADDARKLMRSVEGQEGKAGEVRFRPSARRPLREDWGWATVVNAAAARDGTINVGRVLAQVQASRLEEARTQEPLIRRPRPKGRITI
jgi:hypothetical protein